jgi:rhamnosyltransferase
VLLATYNSARWLDEQLDSIEAQRGVAVRVVASDDASTDQTTAILDARGVHRLPPSGRRMGNANRNFQYLVREAPIGQADYVALSDHDDIWLPDKLRRAVDTLTATGADAYSSDVLAFWPDGREQPVVKSQPQRHYDYLFESAGPGCTFVFRRGAFDALRTWARQRCGDLDAVLVHDWAFYAFGRTRGWHWVIDERVGLRYRQHGGNELGVNTGRRAVWRRLSAVMSGRWRSDVLAVADAVDDTTWVSSAMHRFGVGDRLRLCLHARQCRRRAFDAAAVAVFALIMPRRDARR